MVEVKDVGLKSTDVLGIPKPVSLDDVTEGQLFKLA